MSPLFPAQRRAEHFDSLLEGARRDDLDPRTSELLELVGALRAAPAPEARPEFVADLYCAAMSGDIEDSLEVVNRIGAKDAALGWKLFGR